MSTTAPKKGVDPTTDRVVSIADLCPDKRNANKGTPRGRAALGKSLSQYGAGRSILLDKDNRVIAGNKTVKCAGEIGIDKVRIIETNGKEIIAVKRTDLSLGDKNARGLALADNRVGQLDLDWDAEELSRCAVEGVVDPTMFTQEEIDEIVGDETEKLKEEECELKPYKKVHILISVDVDRVIDVQDAIDAIKNIDGVEVETSAN
jgi:hypothetical protein